MPLRPRFSICRLLLAGLLALLTADSLRAAEPTDRATPSRPATSPSFETDVLPLLGKYCIGCHGGSKPKGGLALDRLRDKASPRGSMKVWRALAERLHAGEMPPPRKPQPTDAERKQLIAWAEANIAAASSRGLDPGRVTLRRLNRIEYNNTIRDLTGVDFHPADDFPADDVGYGFDNVGDVLSMPPILLEKYLAAAEKIVTSALATRQGRRMLFGNAEQMTSAEQARKVLSRFVSRAYRRPASAAEIDRLLRFVTAAANDPASRASSIRSALVAVLVSPHFLFRVELDPRSRDARTPHPITDFEFASRLSYFLWSTMPDDELFHHARRSDLRKPAIIEGQLRRLLRDPKAEALIENFADQWLQIRNLRTASPDPERFPGFDEPLRSAMLRETELFFGAVVHEDRSVLDLLDADFTFANERLARHYGIAGVQGDEFRRVKLAGDARRGLLTQASVLTVTSNPTRTSPTKRGKWILENILGAPPPPPPPDAGVLSDAKAAVQSGSLRRRMEQHRSNPACASCHQRMDPLGFGLENFDAIGAWREKDGDFPIDASGVLPDGQKFRGPAGLRAIVMKNRDTFLRCLTEKMLTYALGRGLELYDEDAVTRICRQVSAADYRFSALVREIVQSTPFQMRRGDP